MPVATYTEFAATPTPWLPDQTFWQQNAFEIQAVMGLVAADFPNQAETVRFDPTVLPPEEQRLALWRLLLGRQHGNMEKSAGKVEVSTERRPAYVRALGEIAIGPHSLMEETPIDPTVEYDQALLNSGIPEQNVARLETADKPNIKEIVALTGQRKRGMWPNVESEQSVEKVLIALENETDVDMAWLRANSPFFKAQLERLDEGIGWDSPFPSEYDMFRASVEAYFFHLIDWDNYDQTVKVQAPIGPNEAVDYMDDGWPVTMPPREEGAVTYHLTDGRKVHVVNGAATSRPYGAPRANSTSIAREAMYYVPVPEKAKVVAICAAPHLRAGMDTITAYIDGTKNRGFKGSIARADVAMGEFDTRSTDITAALGELMATEKGMRRLQALHRGQDPYGPELEAI
jgi:hypothetical protein